MAKRLEKEMPIVYVYVLDTLADWEIGYVTAELNSGRYFKKGAERVSLKYVGCSEKAVTTMGGVTNAVEATEVANLVGAKNNIPIHEFNSGDERKQENFTPEGRLELQYGETIKLSQAKE